MRKTLAMLILALALAGTAAVADDFHCPKPQQLPTTLGLRSSGPDVAPKIAHLQSYLDNIKLILARYQTARSNGQRNVLAICLIDHLIVLPDDQAFQMPKTKADQATWLLFAQEAEAALNSIDRRFLRVEYRMPLLDAWFAAVPPPAQKPLVVSAR